MLNSITVDVNAMKNNSNLLLVLLCFNLAIKEGKEGRKEDEDGERGGRRGEWRGKSLLTVRKMKKKNAFTLLN